MATQKTSTKRIVKEVKKLFPLPIPPTYAIEKTLDVNGYQIKRFELPVMAGYWSSGNDAGVGISLNKNGETIMSCTPMELESHVIAQKSAHGRVVVAGLGLAMITCSLLKKPNIKQLVVLEKERQIIDLYPSILSDDDRALWVQNMKSGRLKVLELDCTEVLPASAREAIGRVDYLWNDTWNALGSKEALPRTQFLCQQLKPKQADYWGWELDVAIRSVLDSRTDTKRSPFTLTTKFLNHLSKEIAVPLSILKLTSAEQKVMTDLIFLAAKSTLVQERSRDREQRLSNVLNG